MQADVLAGFSARSPGAGGDRGRLGGSGCRCSRPPPPRRRLRRGRLVDQRRRVRTVVAGQLLLRTVGAGGVERGHGSGAALPSWEEVDGLDHPANRDRILRAGPARIHRPMERWMAAYCSCGESSSRACPTTTPAGSTSRRWCSAAARPTTTTPARRPSSSRRCSRTPSSSNPRGPTPSGSIGRGGSLAGLRTLAAPGAALADWANATST